MFDIHFHVEKDVVKLIFASSKDKKSVNELQEIYDLVTRYFNDKGYAYRTPIPEPGGNA